MDDGTYNHDPDAIQDVLKQGKELEEAVVGHKIVSAEEYTGEYGWDQGLMLTLDDGTRVKLRETSDCCAFTDLKSFFLDPSSHDHIITSVKLEEEGEKWYILADLQKVLSIDVSWGEGNYPYYPFGFEINVEK